MTRLEPVLKFLNNDRKSERGDAGCASVACGKARRKTRVIIRIPFPQRQYLRSACVRFGSPGETLGEVLLRFEFFFVIFSETVQVDMHGD